MTARYWFLGLCASLAFACGNNSGSKGDAGGGGGDDGGGSNADADPSVGGIDAPPFGGACTPVAGAPQCSDCVDNDSDGYIDGFDPQCTGPLDRLEDSFATGIPGDNIDATMQDCFFDGNSGAGNDGCNQHVCCLLQASNQQTCAMLAPASNATKYDIAACYQPFGSTPVPTKCQMNCGPLAPPGCDCFGCCTVCNGTGCKDIVVNPAVSPNCTQANVTDPGLDGIQGTADDPCKACVKNTNCGTTTCAFNSTTSCTPCPGQCTSNGVCNPPLPSSCGGTSACPTGYTACDAANMNACPAGTYCSSGCCVGILL